MEKRIRAYQITIIGLIVLNIAVVAWQWINQKAGPPLRPEEILKRELHLTDVQMNAYHQLIQEHRQEIGPLREQMKSQKDALFSFSQDDSSTQAAILKIGQLQSEIDRSTYQHFKKVRALCDADQQKKFDQVLARALAGNREERRPPR